jgi:hypothetical protein
MTDEEIDRITETMILPNEGGWSDRKNDRGGPTNRGITLAQWKLYCEDTGQPERANKENLRTSTKEDALKFYRWYIRRSGVLDDKYWFRDDVLPQVIDMVVHHGRWRDIIDSATLVGDTGDDDRLAVARIRYMAEVVQKDPAQKEFFYGWVIRALKAAGWWPRQTPPTKEV